MSANTINFSVLKNILRVSIFFLQVNFFALANANAAIESTLNINIKPVADSKGKVILLEVNEELTAAEGMSDTAISWRAPISIFGVKVVAGRIENFAMSDATGPVQINVTDDHSSFEDGPYRHWSAVKKTTFPVKIHYQIPTQSAEETGPPLGMKAAGGGVAGSAVSFLVLPENSASTTTRLHWNLSNLPRGSEGVITSGKGHVLVEGPPSKMSDQWIIAGPLVSFDSTRSPDFHTYVLGTPPFDINAMSEWADLSYAYLAKSLKYLGTPKYNLFFRALDGPSFGTGTAKTGGGGSLITVGNQYAKNQDLNYIHTTVFHEMAHQWVGEFDSDSPWFSEGLTVYLTAVLPCRGAIDTLQSCAAGINESARNYYGSVARNWSLEKIGATKGQEEVRRVPYGRGMLYFAKLDTQVRAASNGIRGLEDLLYPLFVARLNGVRLTNAVWESAVERELGKWAVDEFRSSVVEGTTTIVPPPNAFGPCFSRKEVILNAKGDNLPLNGFEWFPLKCGN